MFKDIKSEGTRILVKGDPGIGKTTFSHKVAFDWATGCLDLFDVVLVVKLKLADCNQSIEGLIKEQLVADNDVTDSLIGEYLRSGQDRVLLVLDGLDEINLKHYPNVQDVLTGKSFRKCCILVTTRPHLARELKGKMTSIVYLKGFSRSKAEEFIAHIIANKAGRKRFFTQLDRRRMSHMHKIPLIVQALALLFNEDQELPETFTTTYDELVFFLRKTCQASKHLTEEEIRAAMDEINKLAFKGLTREDKQLVFSRDEVKNDNIYKLGLLSGEKTGSGFKPTTVLQFAHATIQENCGADHVVRRLEVNDRGPWNIVVQLFHKTFTAIIKEVAEREQNLSQTRLLTNAIDKCWSAICHSDINTTFIHMMNSPLNIGAFDTELDIASMWEEYSNYPLVAENLNEGEKEAMSDLIFNVLLVDTPSEWKAQQKAWVESLTEHDDKIISNYFMGIQQVVTWIRDDADMAKQKLRDMAAVFRAQGNLPTQSVSQDFIHLWDHLISYKTLFRFIIGKLSPELMQEILLEIAALAVQHSFDENNGAVVPFYLLKSLVEDLMKESKSINDNTSFYGSPVLMHLNRNQTAVDTRQSHQHSALKISGTGRETVNFIISLTEKLGVMTNICTVEIEDILFDQCPVERSEDFVKVLYQSPLVSLELRNLDSKLISLLTQNVPQSVQRLSISRSPDPFSYRLPEIVNLVCLYLEDCTAGITNMVEAHFPKLKKLVIINTNAYCEGDVSAIHRAVQIGRTPKLEDLNIRFGQLGGFGQQLAEILCQPTLRYAQLVGGNMTRQDGSVLLRHIEEGQLDHIRSLNVTNNDDLSPVQDELKAACTLHNIYLEISPARKEPASFVPVMLQLLKPQTTSTGDAAMAIAAPTLDLGALVTNFAPLLTSAATAQPRGANQVPPIDSAVAADIGNVLSSILSSANPTPQPVPTQSGGGTPNQCSQTTSSVGLDLGNVLSSVLGTTNLSQLAVPNLMGGQGSRNTTLPNLTGVQGNQGTTVPNIRGGQGNQGTTLPNLRGGQGSQNTTLPNLTGGQGSQNTTLPNLTGGQSPSVGSGDGFDLGNVLSTVLAAPNPPYSTTTNRPDPIHQPRSNLSSNSTQQTPNFGAMLSTFFNSTNAPPGNQSGYIDEDVE